MHRNKQPSADRRADTAAKRRTLAGLVLLGSIGLGSQVLSQEAPGSQFQTAPASSTAPRAPALVENKPTLAASPPSDQNGPAAAAQTLGSLPSDLSPWSMFLNADIVVKVVMVGLAFASVVTWTVWLAKGLELVWAKRRARAATLKLRRAKNLGRSSASRSSPGGRGTARSPVLSRRRQTRRSSLRACPPMGSRSGSRSSCRGLRREPAGA